MAQRYGLEIECFGLTAREVREAILSVEGLEYGMPARGSGNLGNNASWVLDETGEDRIFGYFESKCLPLRCKENGTENVWIAAHDGSITHSTQGIAHEVISPIMEGEQGLRTVGKVMTALSRAGTRVNMSCGLHTTFGINNSHARFRRMSAKKQAQAISKIVDAYDWFEAGFDALVSPSRRVWNHRASSYARAIHYPRGLSNGYGHMNADDAQVLVRLGAGRGYLNIGNFVEKGIIEFRQHNGTLNRWKIYNWSLLLQRLVQWAINDRHVNYGADLRDFAPNLEGLLDLTACGSDLRSALEARANELDLVHIDEDGVHTYRTLGPRYAERIEIYSARAIEAALEEDSSIIGGSN
jgi:hypothetical protein